MLASLVVVFRETLEAALIVAVVLAACKAIPDRNRWIGIGVAAGVLGAGLVAGGAEWLSEAAAGMGSEIFNAAILGAAVVMLGWHSIWMAKHGRELAAGARQVSDKVAAGSQPLYAIAIVAGVAVLREGAETVLFLYGIAASDTSSGGLTLLGGGAIGLALGVGVGALLYAGLLTLSIAWLFAVTNTLLLLMAAGLAAQSVGFLVQADILPAWGDGLWDTSGLLSESSIPGKLMHTLVGYVSRPAGIQVVAYVVTIAIILAGRGMAGNWQRSARPVVVAIAAILALAVPILASSTPARAEFQVRSPIVEEGEIEIEHNGALLFSKNKAARVREQSYTNEIAYGLTPWWKIEFETEFGGERGDRVTYEATTIENVFQITPQGKYWLDLGFFLEYSRAAHRAHDGDIIEFGPILQKEFDNVLLTLNTFLEHQVSGPDKNTALTYSTAFQAVYRLHPLFAPGFEYYNEIEDLRHPGSWADQEHRIGPVIVGAYRFEGTSAKLKYEVGYLFPLSQESRGGALRWKLEFEFRL